MINTFYNMTACFSISNIRQKLLWTDKVLPDIMNMNFNLLKKRKVLCGGERYEHSIFWTFEYRAWQGAPYGAVEVV